jgi:hypothetical protein
MKPIERLAMYLQFKNLTPHAFEKRIKLSNGYFSKQLKNNGSIGSDILVRIHEQFQDLNLLWLLLGEGQMINENTPFSQQINSQVEEFTNRYTSETKKVKTLEDDIEKLNFVMKDKDKLISLYEFMFHGNSPKASTDVVEENGVQ